MEKPIEWYQWNQVSQKAIFKVPLTDLLYISHSLHIFVNVLSNETETQFNQEYAFKEELQIVIELYVFDFEFVNNNQAEVKMLIVLHITTKVDVTTKCSIDCVLN